MQTSLIKRSESFGVIISVSRILTSLKPEPDPEPAGKTTCAAPLEKTISGVMVSFDPDIPGRRLSLWRDHQTLIRDVNLEMFTKLSSNPYNSAKTISGVMDFLRPRNSVAGSSNFYHQSNLYSTMFTKNVQKYFICAILIKKNLVVISLSDVEIKIK